MITMTITGKTPLEIFSVIRGCNTLIDKDVPAANPEEDKPSTYAPAPVLVSAAPAPIPAPPVMPAPAPVYAAPAPSSAYAAPPAVPPAAPAPTSAPAYTLDQITRAGADLITAKPDLMNALMAMLPKYGVQTLAALKPDQFGAVATELRALGAKI
jgi:hypothetical protein